jgi:hypothetical protein
MNNTNFEGILIQSIVGVTLIYPEFRMVRTMLAKTSFDWTQVVRISYITFRLGLTSSSGVSYAVIGVFYFALLVVIALCGKTKDQAEAK